MAANGTVLDEYLARTRRNSSARQVTFAPRQLRFLVRRRAIVRDGGRGRRMATLSTIIVASTLTTVAVSAVAGAIALPARAVTGVATSKIPAPPTASAPGAGNVATTLRISQLEKSVESSPANGQMWLQLSSAYLRRAFETSDPAFYPLAARSVDKAGKLIGDSPEVLAVKAGLALTRHRFGDARSLSVQLLQQQPTSFSGRIELFDANVELGRYGEAFAAIDDLVDLRPNVATLSRLSYARQLRGDLVGAEAAMREAVSAAAAGSFDRAVALGYLGDVLLEGGRLNAAARAYDEAVAIATVPTAVLGQARVALARGKPQLAASAVDALTARIPLPGALGFRADIARSTGDTAAATDADQLVDASVRLFRANGAVVDAELAVILADRGRGAATEAVATARRAYGERKTIFTADALAWALLVSGRSREALPYAIEAVQTSPSVASVRWHASAVFASVGNVARARAELQAAVRNPWFSPTQRPALEAMATRLHVALIAEPNQPIAAANRP